MIISHSDLDHAGGAAAVHELLPVTEELGALSAHACRAGEAWDWDGVHFELLNGPAPDLSDNDGACVLKITSATLTALLPADIEAISERRLVEHYGEALHADVLLAPHHGSRTSSSTAFIEAVQPRVVIHSAGWHHRFRHPAPEIVARYEATGAVQYQTAESGALRVSLRGGTIEVQEWRRVSARVWSSTQR
jgi:competence protein ComEC